MHIRSHCRGIDNPTVRQMKTIFKKMFVNNELKTHGDGNCIPIEHILILHGDFTAKRIMNSEDVTNVSWRLLNNDSEIDWKTFHKLPNPWNDTYAVEKICSFSVFTENITTYFAGFVVKSLVSKLCCKTCIDATIGAEEDRFSNFINKKMKGG